MKKTFITNLILVLTLNLSIKPFWILGIDRTVQNIVGKTEYGVYTAVSSLTFILCILLDLGITNFNNRNIAQNTHLLSKHFSRLVVLKLFLAFIFLTVCLTTGYLIGYDARRMKLLLILCFTQFLISFVLYLRSNISGMHLFKTDSMLSAMDRMIGIAICVPFIWGHFFAHNIDIMDYVYIQTSAYLLVAIIAFTIVVRKAGFIKFEWTRTFSMMILKKSFPFAVLVMLMSFYNRVDQVMLERLVHDNGAETGLYAQAFRLLDATNMIALLAAGLLLPIFARMLKLGDSVESLVKTSFTLLFALALVVGSGCCFYADKIMSMLYVGDVSEAAMVFRVLMCCFMGSTTQYVFGTLLTANGNLKYMNIIAACGMAVNIGVNLILIPHFHALGAAITSLMTQLLVPGLQVVVAQKVFKFTILPKMMLTLFIFALGAVGLAFGSTHLPFDWRVSFVVFVGVSGIWSLATGVINVKSLIKSVKIG
jgi:O-antigen/teichoic acid export membrane protein